MPARKAGLSKPHFLQKNASSLYMDYKGGSTDLGAHMVPQTNTVTLSENLRDSTAEFVVSQFFLPIFSPSNVPSVCTSKQCPPLYLLLSDFPFMSTSKQVPLHFYF